MSNSTYSSKFFQAQKVRFSKSADEIVPFLVDIFKPKSVIDFGCGVGAWLATFKDCNVPEVLGIDGPWVAREHLLLAGEEFLEQDLTTPPKLKKRFDLAISVEVGEHLPSSAASDFVAAITSASDRIVFSAAIPFQGGTNHVNEQWPEYWADLFRAKGYHVFDIVRPHFWHNNNVEPFYAQNTLVYIKETQVDAFLLQNPGYKEADMNSLSLIHKKMWLGKMEEAQDFTRFGAKKVLQAIVPSIKKAMKRKLKT